MLGADHQDPSALKKAAAINAPRSDWCLSAKPVTNGRVVNRSRKGTAVMIPIHEGVDPDRLEPHREERQLGADEAEQRAVKTAPAASRIASTCRRSDGDL